MHLIFCVIFFDKGIEIKSQVIGRFLLFKNQVKGYARFAGKFFQNNYNESSFAFSFFIITSFVKIRYVTA